MLTVSRGVDGPLFAWHICNYHYRHVFRCAVFSAVRWQSSSAVVIPRPYAAHEMHRAVSSIVNYSSAMSGQFVLSVVLSILTQLSRKAPIWGRLNAQFSVGNYQVRMLPYKQEV